MQRNVPPFVEVSIYERCVYIKNEANTIGVCIYDWIFDDGLNVGKKFQLRPISELSGNLIYS